MIGAALGAPGGLLSPALVVGGLLGGVVGRLLQLIGNCFQKKNKFINHVEQFLHSQIVFTMFMQSN